MAVSLVKGQRVSLDSSMKMVLVGLGWDPNEYADNKKFDLDVAAFVCDSSGNVRCDDDFIFYNHDKTGSGEPISWHNDAIIHSGDDETGGRSATGDDEQIVIDFTKIPDYVQKIVITVTIYEAEKRHLNFGQVRNAYVRVAKIQDKNDQVGINVFQFDLEEEFSIETGIVVCEIYRRNGEWKFNAVGGGCEGGLEALCKRYGVEVLHERY